MDNQIDINLRETVTHGTHDFPFVIYKKKFDGKNLKYISCHWHNEIEIVYCHSGELIYTTNNNSYTLNKDNFIVVNQNILHQADMNGEAKWYAILFDPKMIYGFEESKIKMIMQKTNFINLFIEKEDLVNKVKYLITTYFSDDSPLHEFKIKNILSDIYYDILDIVSKTQPAVIDTNLIKVHKMLEYIYANYKEKITIDDIAYHINSCRSDVCRLFKESLKSSIADYILKLRIEKSISLLMSDNMSIKDIAAETGFNSASYYSEAFKKVNNMTPFEYKKKNKIEEKNASAI